MNTYLSSAELKDEAKEKLTGHYGLLIGSSLLVGIITFFASILLSIIIPANTLPAFFLSEAVSFILSVFIGVFSVGTTLIYMKLSFSGQASLSDLFYGFSHIQTSLGISLVMTALSMILSLSYLVPFTLYQFTRNETYVYAAFVCLALALVIFVPLSLALSQSYYLMLDYPDKSATEILQLSLRITKGHRVRLFYIQVTFIPLLLLGGLSIIGLFWVYPYMNMTMTRFYFDIMKPVQKN